MSVLMTLRSLLFLALMLIAPFAFADREMSNYQLGPGDTIGISVYDEKELSVDKVRLTDAGTVSVPMLGEIKASGSTLSELEARISNDLKKSLVSPNVTVSIQQYRDFFVSGQVYKPGNFPFQPGLTVAKAVAVAGGFKDRASQGHVAIIHEDDPTHTRIKADLGALVMPGDIITIEESFF
jgi:polysaccharide export outer membrane protein